jgi:hypothetical protein
MEQLEIMFTDGIERLEMIRRVKACLKAQFLDLPGNGDRSAN